MRIVSGSRYTYTTTSTIDYDLARQSEIVLQDRDGSCEADAMSS
jgi:hypothetical protein